MSRDDFENDSDYEIGIVYKQDRRWTRQQLKDIHRFDNVKLYPFIEEELGSGEIDTPFPKNIYLHTLLESTTLHGRDIKDIIKTTPIKMEDLIESVGFSLGRAYSSVVSPRQNDWIAVKDGFTKSVFYGLQVLIFLKTKELVFSYKKLGELSRKFVNFEFKELIDHVIEVRRGEVAVKTPLLYKAISFFKQGGFKVSQ